MANSLFLQVIGMNSRAYYSPIAARGENQIAFRSRPYQPANDAVMRRGEPLRKLQVPVMRHRQVPVDQPYLRVWIFRPVFVRDEHLDASHRLLGIPVVAVEFRRRPDYALETVHAGEIGGVQILLDVLDGDAPGIAGALEQGFDLVLHPRLFSEVGPVLEVLQLLLEVGTPARLRREPAFGDLKVGHARFVQRVEKAAVAAGVARRVAAFQNVERRLSSLAGSAGTGHDFLAPDLAQQLEPRRSPAAPAQVTALEPGAQVWILVGEHRKLAGGRMPDQQNVARRVPGHQG